MKILSIETSADDTGIAILEARGGSKDASFRILANNISSQINIHRQYGGIYPMMAKREHIKNLPLVLKKSLKEARISLELIDLICVTYGPGLEPALWTGITFAEELSKKWFAGRRSTIPIMPVNHMEGHAFSPFGKTRGTFKIKSPKTPILSLLVSGGHTELVLSKKWMDYEVIGETLDDAAGEAFDKVARMLGLPYPGGPEISRIAGELRASRERGLAQRGGASRENFHQKIIRAESARDPEFVLPRPMLHSKNFDFSFSGLKTAVLYLTQKIGKLDKKTKSKIALEFENAVVECLVYKTAKAIEKYKVKTLIVGGGVAANEHLRSELKKFLGKKVKILLPEKELTMDNAVMIGMAGYLNYIKNGKKAVAKNIKATGNLRL